MQWRGEFTDLADLATCGDCASGMCWQVAVSDDWLTAERNNSEVPVAPVSSLWETRKDLVFQDFARWAK